VEVCDKREKNTKKNKSSDVAEKRRAPCTRRRTREATVFKKNRRLNIRPQAVSQCVPGGLIRNNMLTTGDWLVKVLRPTRHQIGNFGDVLPSRSLGLTKNISNTRKQTCIRNQIYYNIKWTQKPGLVAFYDIRPENVTGLYWKQ